MRHHHAFNNPVGKMFKYPGELTDRQSADHAATALQCMKRTPRIHQVIFQIRTTHPGRKQRLQFGHFLISLFHKD